MATTQFSLQRVPQGFYSAVDTINGLPQDILAEMCQEVGLFLQYKIGSVNTARFCERIQETCVDTSHHEVQSAINALTFLFRSAASSQASTSELVQQLKVSGAWTKDSLAVVKHVWDQQGKLLTASDSVSQVLNIGQLIDMKWRLGVAIGSDTCRNLNSPFVAMTIKIAEPSGNVVTKSFEMTVPEFQNFSRQMKDMAAMLETV
ncbi:COMM domain-containing protein 6-like isoform X2 [Branchiostoma floridae]|uniref:COMM domain-containing protein 6 n=1 Tax=Branchiostoma floridae TaxID=7739 RepID=A0A9J7LGA6_BRAFL|nr:COMM domain-containing protein 6-like isoform X1 [Branchiostoma floridae]XP_035682406.1 COMM domain-containing protein 6-like isoform X2 [Branchiostoma floridae]